MSKRCPSCKETLEESEFNWKHKGHKLAVYCKKCSREYSKKHYVKNTEYYLIKARQRNKKVRKQIFEFLGQYLQHHNCIDCGETDILVLEFDHKDRNIKTGEISKMIRAGSSFKKIADEIQKCEVRCANCHRRKTEIENMSWKLKFAPVA